MISISFFPQLFLFLFGYSLVVNCQQDIAIELSRYDLDLNEGTLSLFLDVSANQLGPLEVESRTRFLDYSFPAISLSNCGESCSVGAKEVYYLTDGLKAGYSVLFNTTTYVQVITLSPIDLRNIVLHESIGVVNRSPDGLPLNDIEIFIRIENSQMRRFISNTTVFFKQSQWVKSDSFLRYNFGVYIRNSMINCTGENNLKFNVTWNSPAEIQPTFEIRLTIYQNNALLTNGSLVSQIQEFVYQAEGNSFETTLNMDFEALFHYYDVRLSPLPYQMEESIHQSMFNLIDSSFLGNATFKFGMGIFTLTVPFNPNGGICSRVLRESLECSDLSNVISCHYLDSLFSFEATLFFASNISSLIPRFTVTYDSQELFAIGFFPKNALDTINSGMTFTFTMLLNLLGRYSTPIYFQSTHVFNTEAINVVNLDNSPPLSIQPLCANGIYRSEYNLIRVNTPIDFGTTCSGTEYITISAIGKRLQHDNLFTTKTQLAKVGQVDITAPVIAFQSGYWEHFFDSFIIRPVDQNMREELEILIGRYCPSDETYTLINTTYFLPFIAPNADGMVLASASKNTVVIELRGYGFCFPRVDYRIDREINTFTWPNETVNSLEITLEHSLMSDVEQKIFADCRYSDNFENSIFYVCDGLTDTLMPQLIYSGKLNISGDRLERDVVFEFDLKASSQSEGSLPVFAFPYGASAGDREVAKEINVCGEELRLSTFLPSGESIQSSAYVVSNGAISLGRCGAGINPRTFPDASIQTPILAAYWAYHDSREFGDVYYRYATDADTLVNASRIVQDEFDSPGFKADWVIVATWVSVPPSPADRSTYLKCAQFGRGYSEACDSTNSYQCFLTTDGARAYFVCEYLCEHVTWDGSVTEAVIGFNVPKHHNVHQFSGKTGVSKIGCKNTNEDDITRNVLGYEISLSSYSNFIQDQLQTCKEFLEMDNEMFSGTIPGEVASIPCPCWEGQARFDWRFRRISDSEPNTVCYENRWRRFDSFVRCCYTRAVLNTDLSLYTRYSQQRDPDLYEKFDSIRLAVACSYSDSRYQSYYQVRRRSSCQGYRPIRFICIYGDPHYITLDDFEYTFNGFGEYVLVRTLPSVTPSFELHGRTRPFGNVTEASILTGLAFQFDDRAIRLEILLEPSAPLKMETTLSVNQNAETDLTPVLTRQGDNYSNASLDVEVDASSNLVIVLDGSLTLTVSVKNGILDYLLALPPEHKYSTEGLMGTWNDNQADDLTPYNGVAPISTNSSQRRIHYEFGQSWNVSSAPYPLFFYPVGQDSSDYTNNSFVPAFSDELTYSPSATALCGDNPPCLFDFQQTGNAMIAGNSSNQNTDFFVQQMGVSNFPPSLVLVNGSSEIRLIRGEAPHYFTVLLVDEDTGATLQVDSNHNVSFPSVPPGPPTLSRQFTLSLSLPEPANSPFYLTLTGYDVDGANASLEFDIIACACENGGTCRQGVYSLESASFRYKLEACECAAGYTGDVCEGDLDGCTQQECYPGVACTDLPPPSASGQCGACPLGTIGDGLSCADVNECFNETGLSHTCVSPSQTCVNVVGSFRCECAQGYAMQQTAGPCVDIDECALNPCQQMCENTAGGYNCSCYDGFTLNATTGVCGSTQSCSLNCGGNGMCGVVTGSERCFCDSGFEEGGGMCVDINECENSLHNCAHNCTNVAKTYNCSCRSGYVLGRDSLSCEDLNECEDIFTVLCSPGETCVNSVGSYSCTSPSQATTPTTTTPPSSATLTMSLLPLMMAAILLQALCALL